MLGLLVVAGLTYGAYALQGTRLEPSVVTGGVLATALAYLYFVASIHPPRTGGLGGAVEQLFAVVATFLIGLTGGSLLAAWASVAERRTGRSS